MPKIRVQPGMFALWLIVMSLLAGCSSLYHTLLTRLTPSPPAFWLTGTAPASVEPAAVITETPTPVFDCAYVWSSRTLHEISGEINLAFRSQGYPEVDIEVSAYGEDCLDPRTNQVVRFVPLQTDFYINIAVINTADHQVMGDWIEKILRVLKAYPPGTVPGPNPGYIGLMFISGPETVDLWFLRTRGERLVEEGLRGGELFDAIYSLQ